MTVSEIIEMYNVNDPSEGKVSKLSDFLGCSEGDATKLIQSVEVLRTMYEDECNTPRAEKNHSWAKKTVKEYVALRLDVAGDFVPYFNADPCGPAVKVMVQDEDGNLNVHKPWKFVPEDWPFLISLSNEAYIPDLRN